MRHFKSIFYLSLFIGIVLTGCNPNEEIYDKLDEAAEPYQKEVSINFESADYSSLSELVMENADSPADSSAANIIGDFNNFSNDAPPADYIPLYLDNRFRAYGNGSVAKVTYDYYLGALTYLTKFDDAEFYELTEEDYDWFGGSIAQYGNFSSSDPPEENIPAFLEENYPTPDEGFMLEVRYKYYSGEVQDRSGFYLYEEQEWKPVPNVYVLTPSDYDNMGAPGQYDNFSDDVSPDNYLSTFLNLKFPYASEGDVKVTVFQYYTGSGTETRAREYHYDGSKWFEYEPIETRTSQFIHSQGQWVFDPTVKFTMASSDYQIVVDAVREEYGSYFVDEYGTGEYYTGASSYYSNFDLRVEPRQNYYSDEYGDMTEQEVLDLMTARLEVAMQLLLQNKYPDAVPEVSGVPVHYIVTFESYNNDLSRSTWKADMLCTAAGNPPQFELVDDTFIRDGKEVVIPDTGK